MKQLHHNFLGLAISVSVLAAQPVNAQVVQVTGVQLSPTENGLEVILETPKGKSPQAFTTRYGQTLVTDVINTQLALPEGKPFRRDNPAKGIASVIVTQLSGNSIRVTVTGETGILRAKVTQSDRGLVVSVTPAAPTADKPKPTPETPESQRSQAPAKPTNEPASPEVQIEAEPSETSEPSQKPAQAEGERQIDVTVTATRTEEETQDVPRSVTVINREQIEQQTNLTRNLQDTLGKLVPGLSPPTQSSSTFGQSIRGRNTQVLIDGVPQSTSRNVFRDLRTIDPAAIERIEVVRGPSAIYGDGATGGVINIITRTPSEDRLTARTELGVEADSTLRGGSFGNNIQQSFSGTEGNLEYAVSAAFSSTGGFFDAEGDRIPPDPNNQGGFSDATTINLFSKFGVKFGDQRLRFTFNHFDDQQDTEFGSDPTVNTLPGRQKARAREGLVLDELPGNRNTLLNLEYSNENLLGSRVQAQFYYRDYLTQFFPFDGRNFSSLGRQIYQSRVESERYGGRLQIETPLFNQGAARLLWGVDYTNEDTVQPVTTFNPAVFDTSTGLVFQPTGERTWTPRLEQSSLGLFAQLSWDVSDRLILNGGVRYENADLSVDDFTTLANPNTLIPGGDLNFDATLFNVGAVYFLTDELNLFANFAQGFSLADIGLSLRTAPPGFDVETLSPEPQKVDNYEIGIRGQWGTVQASLSGFYNTSDLGTTFTAPGTVVRAPERVYGAELAVDAQPSDRWQVGGSLTLLGGEIDQGDDGDYEALDGFRIPPLKLTAYVENETLPGWRNRLQALLSGNRDVFGDSTAFGRRPVDSYVTVDYISSIQLGSGTLQIGVENLFDSQYFPVVSQLQSNDSAYAAARGRTLSIRYSFEW